MSRFFAGGGSESESESSSDDEQYKGPQTTNQAQIVYSEEEEDVKRVVRSQKEKRFEELSNIIKALRNHKKIKDIGSMLSSFEDFVKAYSKAQQVILKEEKGVIPKFVIRALVELEDFINATWEDKEGRKNMSKVNGKSLGTFRQKFRKHVKETFESDMKKFRESPDQDEDDVEEEEKPVAPDSDSEDEIPTKVVPKKETTTKQAKEKQVKDQSDSEDSIDWGSSDESSESSDDDQDPNDLRKRFLKDPLAADKEEEKREKKEKKEKKPRKEKQQQEQEDDDDEGWETVRHGTAEKPKMFPKDAEINVSVVLTKLSEVMSNRGKKKTDRKLQIEFLNELKSISEQHNLGPAVAVKIHFSIVSAIFDYNLKISEPMKLEYWSKLLEVFNELLKMLNDNLNDIKIAESVTEETEELETKPFRIRGCILTAVERLDDEFIKLLKECDPHSNEYVDRLKDEVTVTKLIEQVLKYVEAQGTPLEICRIYLRKIDHLYYKFDTNVFKKSKGVRTSVDEMEKLCHFIYSNDNTDRLRTRAILSHIYHHALHDNWFAARDLVLMSHLQETIQHSDPSTQILFNRTMANLGLCAFRQGNVKDAHQCLIELMMTAKPKELLAQGLLPQRQHERSAEQEKVEKQRQMPFHMHINLELLECVYLVSAMLLEIPYMAAHEFDARRRMISKTFYQQLRSSERQSLVGPPESMREHVVAAAKAMRQGDWKHCSEFIINKKMNGKVWDLFFEADRVREMLVNFIKEESLRTYLFTYSNVYASISVPYLAEMYELPKQKVHSIISKMIINEELMASLDDPSETVVMHRTEPSRLQALSMQLADKITNLVDANERIFEAKQPNFFQRNQGGYNNRQNQGGNQGYNRNQQFSGNKRQGNRNRMQKVNFHQDEKQGE